MLADAQVVPIVRHAQAAVLVSIAVVEAPVASAHPQNQKKSQYLLLNHLHQPSHLKTHNARQQQKKEPDAVVLPQVMGIAGNMVNNSATESKRTNLF